MNKRMLRSACAFLALSLPLWSAPGATECPKAELDAMIGGTEIGSIYYNDTQPELAELSSQDSFGADLPEKTKELISRFINTGNPRFTIVYHCRTREITDIKMYADYWGVPAIPISESTELTVTALYTIGKRYQGKKLSPKVIQTIGSEFKQVLLGVFQESKIKPTPKKNSR